MQLAISVWRSAWAACLGASAANTGCMAASSHAALASPSITR